MGHYMGNLGSLLVSKVGIDGFRTALRQSSVTPVGLILPL